ncbi:acyl CoA binding protein-domain-containing protein [Syncephalastrum racemosum]|uniref:Acyl CoA binding protein-domain-containing protein n=1 Tax=Syncephalastrum racemosum TaxID=13706 RepID=A0A1X2HG04_SYNRA|nr:acyl CoA binding protein-domain-containing protein [Syncephalastrum racemosum]
MSVTPSHYSSRYVNQRYNKALQIVQHLPASSAFQPSREEKLELYAYYKQVSHGNVNTQRPGIFDMVGRAKWDAWKKLEGLSKTDAKHLYVETLLKSATEAYKKNAGRATAQQIIQAFNIMQPSEDHSSEDDTSSSAAEEEDDEINSLTSADAEEQAYLREIQANAGRMTPASSYSRRRVLSPRSSRPSSALRRRPGSVASQTSASTVTKNNDRLLPHMIPQHERRRAMMAQRTQDDEPLDANPWAPSQPLISTSTTTLTSSPLAPPTPQQHRSTHLTPRQHPHRQHQTGPAPPRSPASMPRPSPDVMSVVALGPATKRALESLQAEVLALNERIDDLRHELARETSRPPSTATPVPPVRRLAASTSGSSDATDDEKWEGWRWVIKAAIKHAAINLISVLIFFYFLYKRKSPVAFAVTDQLSKISTKLRVLLQGSTSATTTIV